MCVCVCVCVRGGGGGGAAWLKEMIGRELCGLHVSLFIRMHLFLNSKEGRIFPEAYPGIHENVMNSKDLPVLFNPSKFCKDILATFKVIHSKAYLYLIIINNVS